MYKESVLGEGLITKLFSSKQYHFKESKAIGFIFSGFKYINLFVSQSHHKVEVVKIPFPVLGALIEV